MEDELEREVSNLISNMPEVADQMFTPVDESQFVGQYEMFALPRYTMLGSSRDLRTGMIAIVANPLRRQRISPLMTSAEIHRAMRWNRWCMIVDVDSEYSHVMVIKGQYKDGGLEERICPSITAWYVVRSSIHSDREGAN